MTTIASKTTPATEVRLSAAGIVRSEWIKLRTVRSTMWCYGLLLIAIVGIGILIASLADFHSSAFTGDPTASTATTIVEAPAKAIVVGLNTGGLRVAVLIIAVLGCLIVTGEYSTGMIRSTFTAAPRRTGALVAKAVVLGVTAFITTAVGVFISALATWPILTGKHIQVDLGSPSVFLKLLGGALYIAMIALLAFGFGTILRSTAGALATVLGLILVAPVILQLLFALTGARWVDNISSILPQNAGSRMFEFSSRSAFSEPATGGWTLNGWEGFGVLLAWLVVVGGYALIQVKRRDA